LSFWDIYNSQNNKSKQGQTKKTINVILLLNCFSTVKFLKLKCFYIEKYYEKQKIFRNKFELIWILGRPPNNLFITYFYFPVIFTELGLVNWAGINFLL
jgi:hypothetical protein